MKAFPTVSGQTGMDLRDYFAAAALQGLLAGMQKGQEAQVLFVPVAAYKIADLMMEARAE
jgi:molybdopterin-guanine dinucleotide biosynthesis protein A